MRRPLRAPLACAFVALACCCVVPGAARADQQRDPERVAGSPNPRAGSKQAQVIDLFRRAEGATVAEVIAATGWQPHTVRGIVSGTLKKKLGLTVTSAKEERGRVYRIAAQAAV